MYNIEFKNPWLLLMLFSVFILIYLRIKNRNKSVNAIKMPSLKSFDSEAKYIRYIDEIFFSLRMLALTLMIVALARPRKVDVVSQIKSDEGVDIMMVIDISKSMLAMDLQPNRIKSLQKVANEFVNKRKTDRIGLVVYSGEAVTKVPLTTDSEVLSSQILNLNLNELEQGTYIGVGLATAINHLEKSQAKSKIVLLMSDGGESPVTDDVINFYIKPEEAAKIASIKGIKVYTIGIGTKGFIPLPPELMWQPQQVFQLDEDLLRNIAEKTGGKYFRATDNNSLKAIYEEVNQLEKSEIDQVKYYNYTEYFRYFLIYAIIILFIEMLSKTLIFKTIN